jgi:hypothetical protein
MLKKSSQALLQFLYSSTKPQDTVLSIFKKFPFKIPPIKLKYKEKEFLITYSNCTDYIIFKVSFL